MIASYWAKSDGTTLIQHSQDVVDAGLKLLDVLVIEKNYWEPKIIRASMFHDFGKIHHDFQAKLRPEGKSSVSIRHELISIFCCLNIPLDEVVSIATHHKGIIQVGESNSKRLSLNAFDMSQKQYEAIKELADVELPAWLTHFKQYVQHCERINAGARRDALASLEPNAVRTSMDTKELLKVLHANHQSALPDHERLNLALMRALLIAADHVASAGKHDYLPKPRLIGMSDFQPRTEGGKIDFRSFQSKMATVRGDALLHAPTGSGKTEAAMCWVTKNQSKNSRLFYLLPYTASANAMIKRLAEIYGDNMVTAMHSKTLDFFFDELASDGYAKKKLDEVQNSLEAQKGAKEKKQLSKEIFYPVKVATPHQIVKNATLARGWEMCLWEYRNATFIFDEFHTYNALLTGLIFATAKWLKREFNARLLFMSATVPQFMEDYMRQYILDRNELNIIKPDRKEASDALILGRKRHILSFQESGTISERVDEIEQLLLDGKKVLVIVNNVKTAQHIFSKITFNGKRALLHSGFNKRDRIEIEKNITSKDNNRIPRLLVATQAVEVSLDIDYDCAFIENAPIDALIQRFGRVNRAGRKGLAAITLIKENEGRTPFYDKDVCERTWSELKKFEAVSLSEDDLINACNIVYKDGYNQEQLKDFELGFNNEIINNFKSRLIAGDWNDAFESIFENDAQKVEVLCENLVDEYKMLVAQKRFIEANQLLVSIYYYQLNGRKTKDRELNLIIGYDFIYDSLIGYTKKAMKEDLFL